MGQTFKTVAEAVLANPDAGNREHQAAAHTLLSGSYSTFTDYLTACPKSVSIDTAAAIYKAYEASL